MSVPDKIIDRIKKLERMAAAGGGASESEMEQALRHIRRLRDEHDVTDDMLRDAPSVSDIIEGMGMEWNRITGWQEQLAFVVADLFDCKWYIKQTYKGRTKAGTDKMYKGIIFYGMPRDVAVACDMYKYSYYVIRLMMRMSYGGGNWNTQHRSYAMGICARMRERVRAMKRDAENETAGVGAIVLCKDALVREYTDGLGLQRTKRGKSQHDAEAHALGFEHGKNVDLSSADRKVRNPAQPKRLS